METLETYAMLTKLTRFEEQKILIIFDFRTHQEVKRLINRSADILNDSYMNLIMGISADKFRHLVVGLARKLRQTYIIFS